MIKLGKLRYKVSFGTKTLTTDDEGYTMVTYNYVANGYAKMVFGAGELEEKKYGLTTSGMVIKMTTHPNPNIAEGNVVLWNNKVYEIMDVAIFVDKYESTLRADKVG